ncbi:182 kDa tankyrase-1-binding protein [Bufo gargarizans]|uniref:182 kDa tankyrase-1-binding protein n=1 Tax=Bufo gargarizans TaxID=30331 RepID=UPI001CF4B7E6|nr:182 kDa tankyrase-1-binding protein [Bufo gargarizans]
MSASNSQQVLENTEPLRGVKHVKPPVKPKPLVPPRPKEIPGSENKSPLLSPTSSQCSPTLDIPSALKISQLTGPQPYGTRRTSLKRWSSSVGEEGNQENNPLSPVENRSTDLPVKIAAKPLSAPSRPLHSGPVWKGKSPFILTTRGWGEQRLNQSRDHNESETTSQKTSSSSVSKDTDSQKRQTTVEESTVLHSESHVGIIPEEKAVAFNVQDSVASPEKLPSRASEDERMVSSGFCSSDRSELQKPSVPLKSDLHYENSKQVSHYDHKEEIMVPPTRTEKKVLSVPIRESFHVPKSQTEDENVKNAIVYNNKISDVRSELGHIVLPGDIHVDKGHLEIRDKNQQPEAEVYSHDLQNIGDVIPQKYTQHTNIAYKQESQHHDQPQPIVPPKPKERKKLSVQFNVPKADDQGEVQRSLGDTESEVQEPKEYRARHKEDGNADMRRWHREDGEEEKPALHGQQKTDEEPVEEQQGKSAGTDESLGFVRTQIANYTMTTDDGIYREDNISKVPTDYTVIHRSEYHGNENIDVGQPDVHGLSLHHKEVKLIDEEKPLISHATQMYENIESGNQETDTKQPDIDDDNRSFNKRQPEADSEVTHVEYMSHFTAPSLERGNDTYSFQDSGTPYIHLYKPSTADDSEFHENTDIKKALPITIESRTDDKLPSQEIYTHAKEFLPSSAQAQPQEELTELENCKPSSKSNLDELEELECSKSKEFHLSHFKDLAGTVTQSTKLSGRRDHKDGIQYYNIYSQNIQDGDKVKHEVKSEDHNFSPSQSEEPLQEGAQSEELVHTYSPSEKLVDTYVPSKEIDHTYAPHKEIDHTYAPSEKSVDTYVPSKEIDHTYSPRKEIDHTYAPSEELVYKCAPSEKPVDTYVPSKVIDHTYAPHKEIDHTYAPSEKSVGTYVPSKEIDHTYSPRKEIDHTYAPSEELVYKCAPTEKPVDTYVPSKVIDHTYAPHKEIDHTDAPHKEIDHTDASSEKSIDTYVQSKEIDYKYAPHKEIDHTYAPSEELVYKYAPSEKSVDTNAQCKEIDHTYAPSEELVHTYTALKQPVHMHESSEEQDQEYPQSREDIHNYAVLKKEQENVVYISEEPDHDYIDSGEESHKYAVLKEAKHACNQSEKLDQTYELPEDHILYNAQSEDLAYRHKPSKTTTITYEQLEKPGNTYDQIKESYTQDIQPKESEKVYEYAEKKYTESEDSPEKIIPYVKQSYELHNQHAQAEETPSELVNYQQAQPEEPDFQQSKSGLPNHLQAQFKGPDYEQPQSEVPDYQKSKEPYYQQGQSEEPNYQQEHSEECPVHHKHSEELYYQQEHSEDPNYQQAQSEEQNYPTTQTEALNFRYQQPESLENNNNSSEDSQFNYYSQQSKQTSEGKSKMSGENNYRLTESTEQEYMDLHTVETDSGHATSAKQDTAESRPEKYLEPQHRYSSPEEYHHNNDSPSETSHKDLLSKDQDLRYPEQEKPKTLDTDFVEPESGNVLPEQQEHKDSDRHSQLHESHTEESHDSQAQDTLDNYTYIQKNINGHSGLEESERKDNRSSGPKLSDDIHKESPEEIVSDTGETIEDSNFDFLEGTSVLDTSLMRSRASLGKKRCPRTPATGTCTSQEEADPEYWMFRDSTEPGISPKKDSDNEEKEETSDCTQENSPRSVKSPTKKGGIFSGIISPSILKGRLKSRNKEKDKEKNEDEAAKAEAKESQEPTSPGKDKSDSSSHSLNWLQALKKKKKKQPK